MLGDKFKDFNIVNLIANVLNVTLDQHNTNRFVLHPERRGNAV